MARASRGHRVLAAAIWVLTIAACTGDREEIRAGIDGSNTLVRAGNLLFVTATEDDELRVIDLEADPQAFVVAPNPLHPALSIPVVDRPVALARDVVWTSDGKASEGAYVYALSGNSRQLSIVSAGPGPDSLVEKAIFSADAGHTLTAMAAQGGSAGGENTLFVATFDGFDARIVRIGVPVLADPKAAVVPVSRGAISMLLPDGSDAGRCAAVTSLLVLPQGRLAWSSRPVSCRDNTQPPPARAGIIDDPISPAVATWTPLQFPDGVAVRKLFTHDAFTHGEGEGTTPTPHSAAERIFGVLDEGSCGGALDCRGIFAVVGPGTATPTAGDGCGAALGSPACDFTGRRMLPIRGDRSLIMDAALVSGAAPVIPSEELGSGADKTGLIGVFTTSDGRMVFFDAQRLRHFDVDTAAPSIVGPVVRAADGTLTANQGPGPANVKIADGAARDEVISFTFLGDLPGFSKITAPAVPSTQFPVGAVDPAVFVQAGDVAYAEPTGDGATGCAEPREAQVAAVGAGSVTLDGALGGPACVLTLRAGAVDPWVVSGTVSGYLGRIAASTTDRNVILPTPLLPPRDFTYNRPFPIVPDAPLLELTFRDPPALDDASLRQPKFRVEMGIEDAFARAEVSVNSTAALTRGVSSGRLGPFVAGGIVFWPGKPAGEDGEGGVAPQLYVAYPSANAVLRFEISALAGGVPAIVFEPFL